MATLVLLLASVVHAEEGAERGVALAAAGQYQQAWAFLKEETGGSSAVQTARVITAATLGFGIEAAKSADALVANDRTSAEQLMDAGESLGQIALFAPAVNCFSAALKRAPGSFRAAMDLAATYHAQEKFLEAAVAAKRASLLQPTSFQANYVLGSALISSGKTVEGLMALREARKLRPSNVGLLTLLGVEYIKERYFSEAVEVLQSAVTLEPESERLALLLISAVQSHSSAKQAKDIALRALQNIPHSARLYMQLGVEEEALGDLASAKQHYRRSIELDPSIAESHYLLGDMLYREGEDYPRAIEFLQQAIDLAPDFTDAYLRMGSAQIAMEKYSDAETTLNRAVKTAPDDSRLYARLITCYRKEGQQQKLQEAVTVLSRLHRRDEGGLVPQERAFP